MKICRKASVLVLTLLMAFLLFNCGGSSSDSPAPPPQPQPTATTGVASSITTDNAVVNGTVNPNGLDTDAWFEVGTDNSLGTVDITTTPQAVGSDNLAVAVNQTVTGLDPGTTYYYRVVAQSSAGTAKGTIRSFMTAAPVAPPSVQTLGSSNVTTDNAVLMGSVNPNGLATNAWFQWGTDNTFSTFTETPMQAKGDGASSVPVNATISGLSANTTYYFRLLASNSQGTSQGAALNFPTPQNPPPTADAGSDQVGYWLGASGANVFTLDGSGSSDPYGTITDYQWTQMSGPNVTLDDPTAENPSFTAPAITYPPNGSETLTFQLEVTDDRGLSGTDTVDVNVKWAYNDDFSTDTTGTYTIDTGAGSFTLDSGAALVETGVGDYLLFEHDIDFPALYTRPFQGVFALNYTPVAKYGSGGGIDIRFGEVYDNVYIRISTIDQVVEKSFGATKVSVPFNPSVTTGTNYFIKIAFTSSNVVVTFGGEAPVVLTADINIPVEYFWISTAEQDAYYDNIVLDELY